MARAVKILKWILWPAALVGLIWCVYFAGAIYLDIDEVADCNWKQWRAGGKQQPEMDIASNVIFQRKEGNIVADFRGLQKSWSHVCLTSFYQPGSPYLDPRDSHWGAGTNMRTIGCWRGDDPSHLALILANSKTVENEQYQIPVPTQLRDPGRGRVLATNYRRVLPLDYRIPELPDGVRQCSETSIAVATCLRDADAYPGYCLLVFHQ
jgi:hypothetical protein